MLECRNLAVSYGRHRALDDVAIRIAPGEIVVILGANGAGKSTLLKAIAGLVPAAPGSQITLGGKSIAGVPPHRIVEEGLALVPEGRGIFGDLRVQENLLLGAHARRSRNAERQNLDRVLGLFPRLAERRKQVARTMSGGEQQMVAVGRAMMSAPSILMLDEPSLGLSPILCSELFKALAEIRKTGAGILLVEQNARQGLAIADRAYLLENGHIVGEGQAASLAQDPAVQAAYLGGAAHGGDMAARPAAPAPTAVRAPSAAVERAMQGAAEALAKLLPCAPSGAAERAVLGAAEALAKVHHPAPAAAATRSVRAESLIPTRIADLVNQAVERQAEHVRAQRASTGSTRDFAATAATSGDSLADALARIETAAAGARTKSKTGRSTKRPDGTEGSEGG
jgi:branched-chain amino acid transport system ATP-binding protein